MKQHSKVLTLILFSFILSNLSAQEDGFEDDPTVEEASNERKFRLGLQFIPTVSWMSPNTTGYNDDGSKFSFTYGLSTEFFLTKNYLISTGVFIASLGGDLKYEGIYSDDLGTNFQTTINQSYNIQYLEIPLTLKLRTNQIGYMTYYGNFGLRTAFELKGNSDITYVDVSKTVEGVDISSDLFFMNTWLVIGAGVEYNISGNTNISFGVTYNNGFINVLDSDAHQLDASGKAQIDANGNPVFTGKDVSANINYFAFEIGFYF